MNYTHLTELERYQIYALHNKGCDQAVIAHFLSRSRSTISRELRRNAGRRGYWPKQAHQLADARRRKANACNVRKVHPETMRKAEMLLRQDHSPEQVSGRLHRLNLGQVSHETLYRHIYTVKAAGGSMHLHLRCQKKRKKRYGSGRNRRGCIPNRVGIELRSPRIENRSQVGHWEIDTVVGCNHKGFVVTMVERKSRFALVCKVEKKTADEVADAIIKQLSPYARCVKTLTFDNGLEFAQHELIARALACKTYFAHPYSSWERATNENTNGLIRQYLPKGSSFEEVEYLRTSMIEYRLNNRPRKCLDYETPAEVFFRSGNLRRVALGT